MNDAVRPWLEKAQGDWLVMQKLAADPQPEFAAAICFHAQQCVEKLMKALLIANHRLDPPKTHNLRYLSRLIREVLPDWEADNEELYQLSFGAVTTRYPGDEAIEEDATWCRETAERLRAELLGLLGVDPDATPPDPAPG